MRKLFFSTALAAYAALLGAFCFNRAVFAQAPVPPAAAPLFASSNAAPTLPILRTNTNKLDTRVGKTLTKGNWSLAPDAKPDVFTVDVAPQKTETVTFLSDVDKVTFTIRQGQSVDFNVVKGDMVCWTRITGVPPAANYDAAYRKANKGKIAASVPEVYELINFVIALTDSAEKSDQLVYKNSPYWKEVQAWFGTFRDDVVVKAIDAQIKADNFAYFTLKMNGNAFEFDGAEHIVNRKLYDRTGFSGSSANDLRPFVADLERFAKQTKFREFYRKHTGLYADECDAFLNGLNLMGMQNWLQSRFPETKPYDFVDVVFSPLVAWNQSTTWFESNGFRTLQPHVNFPYPNDVPKRTPPLTDKAVAVTRGRIVFTEMNHGYLSPQSARNQDKILAATSKTEGWLVESMRQNYSGTAVFDEYMNWGLISLWAMDTVPEEADYIADGVVGVMKRRGFTRYAEFQSFLIYTYQNRKSGQSVSSLYPQIIRWFEQHNN